MRKLIALISFLFLCGAAFGQLPQFRMIGSGSWTTVNDSTFSSTVTIQSDLTSNGFLPTSITTGEKIFSQTGQRYRISIATGLTFSSADLTIVESGGDWGAPVGQVMIYDPAGRTAVPSIPFGATGATAKMQEAIDSYNSTLIGIGGGDVTQAQLNDSTAAVRSDFPTGGASTAIYDIGRLPLINMKIPSLGLGANEEVTNYEANDINHQKFYFSSTEEYGTGGERGGWLANGTSGDSVFVSVPFGVKIGDSMAEGHNVGHGRLHPSGVATFDANHLDVPGVPSYHLREETKMRWFNHGIGGQNTAQILARFDRDALGLISNPGDGRGSKTLERKPFIVIVTAGINDFYTGLNVDDTKANLEAMASKLAANGIYGVFLNIPGDEINNPTQNAQIDSVNTWLAEGALNPYGITIVDYNLWWKGFDKEASNIDKGPLIQDDIHPTAVGYDSLAAYIAREAKLPKLDSLIIHTKIRPSGITGYGRPTSIRVDGNTTFAITDSIMPLVISQEMSCDSISLSILASASVTGTSTTGISHVEWVVSNTYAGTELVTRKEPDFPGKAADKWVGSSNISPSIAESVSIGVSSQYDANTVLTIKGKGTSNVNDVAFLDYTNTLRGVIRMGTGAMKLGVNKSSPAYPLHVEGTVSFDNAGTYFSATGSNVSLYGGNPVFAFQSTTASPYRQASFSYDAGNRVFSLTPRAAPNGQNYKFVLQDSLSQFPFVFDLRTQNLGLGQTENPREELEMKGNILLAGSADNTTASELIFHDRRATENYSSLRSQDVTINTRYSLPSGGSSTYGKSLHNNTGDSLSWDFVAAENVTILDTESVFDSTTVEGALEELDEMSRNKFFYISGTNTLPLAKGNTVLIIDGTTGPFTVTLTVTNLRVGDEVKVFCNGGSVTLDSSSGVFLRPSVGTNESTIPIDAEGYVLVWDGTNFYQVN